MRQEKAMMHWQESEERGEPDGPIEWQMTHHIDQLLDKVPHFKNDSFRFKTSKNES